MVPGEICVRRPERSNRYHEIALNTQKSAEAIVAGNLFFSVKGRINRSSQYNRERRNEEIEYRKQRKLLTKR